MHRQFTIITKLENRLIDIKTQLEMTQAELERCAERSEELELYCKLFDGGMLLNCVLHTVCCIKYTTMSHEGISVTKKEQYGLCTEDEILKEFKRKIRRLYNFVTDSFTMDIEVKPLSMLTTGISATQYSAISESHLCSTPLL